MISTWSARSPTTGATRRRARRSWNGSTPAKRPERPRPAERGMSGDLDVVVIGAGAAGLAAGRAAQEAGVAFAVIEATSRAGGAGHTARGHLPAPVHPCFPRAHLAPAHPV